jgi:acetylornithine deacetylase/succinyl-diaminopimelate desuccinylase-like protein
MRGFLERLGLEKLSAQDLAVHPLLTIPALQAMFQDTMSLTMLEAGSRPNVIPERAEATLDLRVLPDRTTQEVFDELKATLPAGPFRTESIMAIDASSSSMDTELWQCLERIAGRFFPGATFLPAISPGFTDSRCFRKLGTACYGWIPALFEADDLECIHGKDERIQIRGLVLGTKVILEMIKELCGRP